MDVSWLCRILGGAYLGSMLVVNMVAAQDKPGPLTSKRFEELVANGVSNLPVGFHGHDIISIANRVKSSPTLKPKSEFETSDEFAQRVNNSSTQEFAPGISPASLLAFSLDKTELLSRLTIDYDADAQRLSVTLDPEKLVFYSEGDLRELDALRLRSVAKSGQVYTGTNAFGVKVQVTSIVEDVYGIVFEQDSSLFPRDDYAGKFEASIDLSPQAHVPSKTI
jgi:hypothetical protein